MAIEDVFSRIVDILGDIFGGIGRGVERGITSLFGSSNARYLKRLQPRTEGRIDQGN